MPQFIIIIIIITGKSLPIIKLLYINSFSAATKLKTAQVKYNDHLSIKLVCKLIYCMKIGGSWVNLDEKAS